MHFPDYYLPPIDRLEIDPPPTPEPLDMDMMEIDEEEIEEPSLKSLPADVIAIIFSMLDKKDILSTMCTCRNIYSIGREIFGAQSLVYALENCKHKIALTLSKIQHLNHSFQNHCGLKLACLNGDLAIVKNLISNPKVDPTASNYEAFRIACDEGHVEIVKIFLEDPRTNLSACGKYAVEFAFNFNHPDILSILLQNPRVKVDQEDLNLYFAEAVRKGYTAIVNVGLKHSQIDPTAFGNAAFKDAISSKSHLLSVLAQDKRVRGYRSPGTLHSPKLPCQTSPKTRILHR